LPTIRCVSSPEPSLMVSIAHEMAEIIWPSVTVIGTRPPRVEVVVVTARVVKSFVSTGVGGGEEAVGAVVDISDEEEGVVTKLVLVVSVAPMMMVGAGVEGGKVDGSVEGTQSY